MDHGFVKSRLPKLAAVPLIVALVQCDSNPVAPKDSTIELVVGSNSLPADGGLTLVSVLATDVDGLPVDDGTVVFLIANGGDLCAVSRQFGRFDVQNPTEPALRCRWSPILTITTEDGVGAAFVRANAAGTIGVEARSGSSKSTARTISVSSLVAPEGSKVTFEAVPDTTSRNVSTRLVALFVDSMGAPVQNGTRVVFSADNGSLGQKLGLTHDGFAETSYKSDSLGEQTVRVSSGKASANLRVFIQE